MLNSRDSRRDQYALEASLDDYDDFAPSRESREYLTSKSYDSSVQYGESSRGRYVTEDDGEYYEDSYSQQQVGNAHNTKTDKHSDQVTAKFEANQDSTRAISKDSSEASQSVQVPKQSINFRALSDSSKHLSRVSEGVAGWFRKIGTLESDWSLGVLKVCSTTVIGKDGSLEKGIVGVVGVHAAIAQKRLEFGKRLGEISESFSTLAKNTERSRKQLKESLLKHEKAVNDTIAAQSKLEKKLEIAQSELFLSNSGNSSEGGLPPISKMAKVFSKLGLKNVQSASEITAKVVFCNNAVKNAMARSNAAKSEFEQLHYPRLCTSLLDVVIDTEHQIINIFKEYTSLKESGLVNECLLVDGGNEMQGMMALIDSIKLTEPSADSFCDSGIGMRTINSMSSITITQSAAFEVQPKAVSASKYFGKQLQYLLQTTSSPVPLPVKTCIDYIQSTGLYSEGIYRISGNITQVSRLKDMLDSQGNIALEDVVTDVHVVCSVLKLFFREIPDCLIPTDKFQKVAEAARIYESNPKMAVVRVHELVNSLEDANYATLKYLTSHLSSVQEHSQRNKMTTANLGIIWGPTLMDSGLEVPNSKDLEYSARVIELIIDNAKNIFEFEEE